MVSTPSTRLRLEKQALGENLNTWGQSRLNDALERLDEAIAGVQAVTISGASTTLTSTNYATDEARKAALVLSGTLSANSTVTVPNVEKLYLIVNNTTQGAYSLTIKTAAGSGYALRPGPQQVYCDATDVYRATPRLDHLPLAASSLDMNSQKITGLGTPTLGTDATTKTYVDAAASSVNASGAAASASAAATSASSAATSATAAATSATSAATSATSAAASAASVAGGPVASINGLTGVVTITDTVTGQNAGFTVYSPTDVTLSNQGRTYTSSHASGVRGARAGIGRSSGKWYVEFRLDGGLSLAGWGVTSNTSTSVLTTQIGTGASTWGLVNATDGIWASGVNQTAVSFTPALGDVYGIAVDLDTGKLWASRNGSWFASGDPAAGTNAGATGVTGTVYPAANTYGAGGSNTIRLARHEFSYAPPSGFLPWAGEVEAGNGSASPILAGTARLAGRLVSDVVAASTSTLDLSLGQYFTRTISGASAFVFSAPPTTGAFEFTLEVTHTSGAITWPASVSWPAGTTPTLTTGKTHLFRFVTRDGGTKWRGMAWVDYTT